MEHFDIAVIGSGPAGQKAAVQGAKGNQRVVVIERERRVGGACVHRGTIPSKTLREAALQFSLARRTLKGAAIELGDDRAVANLMDRLDAVLDQHERFWIDQLRRNRIELRTGRASFVAPGRLAIAAMDGSRTEIGFDTAIIATGSRPRDPPGIDIDHGRILDSDSILSIKYLPKSLIVLGAGVIAAEYASIFASLGVRVTMVDRGSRPVPFLDPEMSEHFTAAFQAAGGRYLPGQEIGSVTVSGLTEVECTLASGRVLTAERMLVALGRQPNSDGLNLDKVGVRWNERGLIQVDGVGWTGAAGIYAVGDVIGPPSLASTSMEQGRRAVRHALGLDVAGAKDAPGSMEVVPTGVYTIPEISSVGLLEAQAVERFGSCLVGRARYEEVARGCIAGDREGLVKLIAEPETQRIVGVHIVGTSASELVHIGQMALLANWTADQFVDNVFNFPTFAEAYRIAALDLQKAARAASVKDWAFAAPV